MALVHGEEIRGPTYTRRGNSSPATGRSLIRCRSGATIVINRCRRSITPHRSGEPAYLTRPKTSLTG